ncbi:MAG: hypothetical protein LBN10_03990 [Propionibacteriaceae bacterium]|jgi:hypothetical protein|nr:hypothetical protein [Propionibacteriaceae bacterium]
MESRALRVALKEKKSDRRQVRAVGRLEDQELLYTVVYQQASYSAAWKAAFIRLDIAHLERLLGGVPPHPGSTVNGSTEEWRYFATKQERGIERLGELVKGGDVEAEGVLRRFLDGDRDVVLYQAACTAVGHVTDSECSSCERCGQAPCHVFGQVVVEPGTPEVHVRRCQVCGIIKRWWSETCRDCSGTGYSYYEIVDRGSNSGAVLDSAECENCGKSGSIRHETLTRE